jgi:hypothetical protein
MFMGDAIAGVGLARRVWLRKPSHNGGNLWATYWTVSNEAHLQLKSLTDDASIALALLERASSRAERGK